MIRSQSLQSLVRAAALPAAEACRAVQEELVVRMQSQTALCEALLVAHGGDSGGRGALRTLSGLHGGVLRDLEAFAHLAGRSEHVDVCHRELMRVEARHSLTLTSIVDVLSELEEPRPGALEALSCVARQHVGAALLLRHHLAAHASDLENLPSARRRAQGLVDAAPDEVGALRLELPLLESVEAAAREVELLADSAAVAAGVEVPSVDVTGDLDLVAAAAPHHVGQIVMELLKNAFRATLEGDAPSSPVFVRLEAVDSGASIAVVDRGRGVPGGHDAFQALTSLRPGRRYDRVDDQTSYAKVPDPLHGIGVGLPVSRFTAEHFQGNALRLESEPGNTVATLTLLSDTERPEYQTDPAAALNLLLGT